MTGPASTPLLTDRKRLPLRPYLFFDVGNDAFLNRLTISAAGLQHEYGIRTRYDWDNRRRMQTEDYGSWVLFQYTIAGRGGFRDAQGCDHNIDTGTAFIAIVPSDTCYWLPRESHWEWIWARLCGDQALAMTAELIARYGHILDLDPCSPPLATLGHLYADACAGRHPTAMELALIGHRFLIELWEALQPVVDGSAIAVARRHMEQHLADPNLDVTAIAAIAGLSRAHFSRVFQACTGCSPGRFLARRRMQRAAELLRTTSSDVATIAGQVGFRDASHFGALFRRQYGVTPGRFREAPGSSG